MCVYRRIGYYTHVATHQIPSVTTDPLTSFASRKVYLDSRNEKDIHHPLYTHNCSAPNNRAGPLVIFLYSKL